MGDKSRRSIEDRVALQIWGVLVSEEYLGGFNPSVIAHACAINLSTAGLLAKEVASEAIPDTMQLALMEPGPFGPLCGVTRISRRGWTVATCTRPAGARHTHVDRDTGATWST